MESVLTGTAAQPIILRAVPGERVKIDMYQAGGSSQERFSISGDHAWYWGLEITSSNPASRVRQSAGTLPGTVANYGGSSGKVGDHIRLINVLIHDLRGNGLSWHPGQGGEVYGSLIYNNGSVAPDRTHGHGIYTQNKEGTTPEKRIADNFIFNQFWNNCSLRGGDAYLHNFRVEGNALFNAGAGQGIGFRDTGDFFLGTSSAAHNNTVIGNAVYSQHASGGAVHIAYGRADYQTLDFSDNYVVGRLGFFQPYVDLHAARNTVVGSVTGDAPSSGIALVQNPGGQKVLVRGNEYEPGRANVVVYNWNKAASVSVDLSDVLAPGASYRIQHVYDFFGEPVAQGIYTGGSVSIPMLPKIAPRPLGAGFGECATGDDGDTWCLKEPTTLPITFGAFVVLSDGCGDSTPVVPPKASTCDSSIEGDCWYDYAEAENQKLESPMAVSSHADASGASYVSSATESEGQIDFIVNPPKSGDYVVWARVLAPVATADSFWVSSNGGAWDVYDVAEGTWSEQWQWTRVNGRTKVRIHGFSLLMRGLTR
ncbi:MAG: hypothetical protein R3C68_11630 [Myxococcota bacterium]